IVRSPSTEKITQFEGIEMNLEEKDNQEDAEKSSCTLRDWSVFEARWFTTSPPSSPQQEERRDKKGVKKDKKLLLPGGLYHIEEIVEGSGRYQLKRVTQSYFLERRRASQLQRAGIKKSIAHHRGPAYLRAFRLLIHQKREEEFY